MKENSFIENWNLDVGDFPLIDYNFSHTIPNLHMAHETSDGTFENDVLKADLPVLVDFWAPWCGPCKAMNPVMQELEQEYAGKVNIVKMNVDENMTVPGNYNVMSIPTFVIFKGGKIASQFVGARSKGDMQKELDAVLAA